MPEPLLLYLPQDNSLITNPDAELVVSRIAGQLGSLLSKPDDAFWETVDANAPGLATTLDSYLCHTQYALLSTQIPTPQHPPPGAHTTSPMAPHYHRLPHDNNSPATSFSPACACTHAVCCQPTASTITHHCHTGPAHPTRPNGMAPPEPPCSTTAACWQCRSYSTCACSTGEPTHPSCDSSSHSLSPCSHATLVGIGGACVCGNATLYNTCICNFVAPPVC